MAFLMETKCRNEPPAQGNHRMLMGSAITPELETGYATRLCHAMGLPGNGGVFSGNAFGPRLARLAKVK